MSASGKARSRKVGGKNVKLPEGAGPLNKYVESYRSKPGTPDVDEKVEEFCDSLMTSEWEPHYSRPKHDCFGFYVICRWYPADAMWVILYVGRGFIRSRLESHFSGRQRKAISGYLSSFPKASRSLIWIKWIRDPFYPYEGISMDDLMAVVQFKYNNGDRPAFNLEDDGTGGMQHAHKSHRHTHNEELPEDFSIIPDWHKPGKKKDKAAASS